MKTFQFCGRLH